jgi:hypothetical protein
VLEVDRHYLPLLMVPKLGCEGYTGAIEGAVAGIVRRTQRATYAEAWIVCTVRINISWVAPVNSKRLFRCRSAIYLRCIAFLFITQAQT